MVDPDLRSPKRGTPMRPALLPLLLAFSLLLPVMSLGAAAKGDDDGDEDGDDPSSRGRTRSDSAGSSGSGRSSASTDDNDPDDDDDDDRDRSSRRDRDRDDEGAPAVGQFEVRSGERSVVGEFLNFQYDEAGVHGYAINGTHLFNATILPDEEDDDDGRRRSTETLARGSEIRVRTPGYEIRAHDNPGAVTKIETDGDVSLHFAPNVNVTLLDGDRARFQIDDLAGTIRGDDLSLVGDELRSGDGVLLFLDAPRGDFDRHRKDLDDAISKGHIGAELSVVREDDTNLTEDTVSYGNVTLKTLKAEHGNLTVLIDGHGFEGRVLVFNVDGRVHGAERAEDLDIKFDNESISSASNLTDILNPDDDGLDAEYYVVFDPQTQSFQLIVTVPHYSVHVLSVGIIPIPLKPSVVVGVLAGVALLAPAGYVLFRRRG